MSEERHTLCSPRRYGNLPPTAVSHLQKHYGLYYHGTDFLYSVLPCRADIPAPRELTWGFQNGAVYHHMAAGVQTPEGARGRVNSAVQQSPQGE